MPGNVTNQHPIKGEWGFTPSNLDRLNQAKVDNMVSRILLPMQKYGLMDPENMGCPPEGCEYAWFNATATSPERRALSKTLATASVIMLKNDGLLPFGPDIKRIAVLGSACNASNDIDMQLSHWQAGSYYTIGGSARIIPASVVSPLQGIQDHCRAADCEVVFDPSDDPLMAFAVARGADAAVACGGATSTEDKDRPSLSVNEEAYLVIVASLIKIPLAILTMTPGSIVMPWIEDVSAALNIFFGGEFTGDAFANVLFGKYNPGAKSPVVFPKREGAVVEPCTGPPICDPPDCQYDCAYSEGLFVAWHGIADEDVLFPFGHGLSYTSFSYKLVGIFPLAKGAKTSSQHEGGCDVGAEICIVVQLENIGKMAGEEVAQLYLGYPESAEEPPKVLRGFKKVPLETGSTANVYFPLYPRDLQIWSMDTNMWIYPDGRFTALVGSSSQDIRVSDEFGMCKGVVYDAFDPSLRDCTAA